ncbi:hypothetical protein FHS29_006116 [Saccharothrix tamanrassetensis]|uniref:Uncharacterized protein n=1 Tax=Saccharothrix tamanrassetensis TaxID=1051531 RepID=A0A841CU78_9PSEU|nr:hypothetical protein [Saccharothrix tamanrassetensis]MBB5959495.1 hypothetical protein [Saccharothrix tamanrassetensis]
MRTFAVAVIAMVTGSGPQSNVTTPPAATAATTASDVQLAAVPLPTTVVGLELSSGPASGGTSAVPAGFPAGSGRGLAVVVVVVVVAVVVVVVSVVVVVVMGDDDDEGAAAGCDDVPHAASTRVNTTTQGPQRRDMRAP